MPHCLTLFQHLQGIFWWHSFPMECNISFYFNIDMFNVLFYFCYKIFTFNIQITN